MGAYNVYQRVLIPESALIYRYSVDGTKTETCRQGHVIHSLQY